MDTKLLVISIAIPVIVEIVKICAKLMFKAAKKGQIRSVVKRAAATLMEPMRIAVFADAIGLLALMTAATSRFKPATPLVGADVPELLAMSIFGSLMLHALIRDSARLVARNQQRWEERQLPKLDKEL